MNVAFRSILNLEIWHDYYLGQSEQLDALPAQYHISDTIALIPTRECQTMLRNLRWLVREQPSGAVLLAHIDASAVTDGLMPIVALDTSTCLTFWLVVRDRNFANYTNLPLDAPRNRIYYFSNRPGSQVGNHLFLTQPLPSYQPESEYTLGQLVSYQNRSETATLEAIQHQVSASSTPQILSFDPANGSLDNGSLNNGANSQNSSGEWLKLPSSQYVSVQDSLPRQSLVRTQPIAAAQPGQLLRFSLVNLNDQERWSLSVQVPPDHPAGEPWSVSLNFAGQQPGYYQLLLNGKQIDQFVLFDPMAGRDAFGLIEISLHPKAVSPAFRLLNTNGKTFPSQPKTYRIRFKNRATRWRYRSERSHGFTATQLPANLQLIDEQTYATKYPLGLCHQPKRLLTDGNRTLPAPSISMIQPLIEVKPDGRRAITAIFSDTYL
jgi:hypothetical protein